MLSAITFAGCGADTEGTARWKGEIDTLPGGIPVVSSPDAGIWDSTSRWRLAEDLRIGSLEGGGAEAFGSVAGIAVDGFGRIHVLDRQAGEIRVFDRDGRHLRTVGRSGEGPGELADPIGIDVGPRGRLWIVDVANGRYTVFDTAGDYVASYRRRIRGYGVPWKGGFDETGGLREWSVVSGPDGVRFALVRFDSALATADTSFLPEYEEQIYEHRTESGWLAAPVPYTPARVTALAEDGTLWMGINDRYAFANVSPGGDTLRVVRRAFERAPVTRADREEALEDLEWFTRQGGRIEPSRLPDTKPAYAWIAVAPSGHLWVAPILANQETGSLLDVFDPAGRYLGRIRSPVRLVDARLGFRGNELYGLTADELGVTYVVRLRVQRSPDGSPGPTNGSLDRTSLLERAGGRARAER